MAVALRRRWFNNALLFAFLAVFVWLRWFSAFWQHRWTGLCFGVAFILTFRPTRTRMQMHVDFAKKYEFPRRGNLVAGISCIVLGGIALRDFLTGRSFFSFSGVRAASDDGLLAVSMLAAGFEMIYLSRLLARTDHRPSSASTNTSHG